MDGIISAINNLITWFSNLPQWFYDLLKDLVSTVFDMLIDVLAFFLDKLFVSVITIVNALPAPPVSFNATTVLNGAPAEMIGILIAIRIPEAFAIILAALLIRFALGLIPFVRVGG